MIGNFYDAMVEVPARDADIVAALARAYLDHCATEVYAVVRNFDGGRFFATFGSLELADALVTGRDIAEIMRDNGAYAYCRGLNAGDAPNGTRAKMTGADIDGIFLTEDERMIYIDLPRRLDAQMNAVRTDDCGRKHYVRRPTDLGCYGRCDRLEAEAEKEKAAEKAKEKAKEEKRKKRGRD